MKKSLPSLLQVNSWVLGQCYLISKMNSLPAIMIYPLSPAIGNGWIEDKSICENNTGESFVQCMEEISYSTEDIINNNDANDVLNVKSVYTTNWDGIVQSVEIFKETAITYDFSTTNTLVLNNDNNISYLIYIMDKKLEFVTGSPVIIPRSMIILKHKAGETFLYLKAIRHEKLNRPDKPCEPSPEYNLASCLEKSVISRAGCQPPWRRFIVEGLSPCDNMSMLNKFGEEYMSFYNMEKHKLFVETKCEMPCTFMEYKVSR